MVPRRTSRSTPSTATKPLNSLVSLRVCRMMSSAMPAGRRRRLESPLDRRAIIRKRPGVGNGRRQDFAPLSGFPLRLAFADERRDAFVGVGLEQAAGHHAAAIVVGRRQAEVELVIERLLA